MPSTRWVRLTVSPLVVYLSLSWFGCADPGNEFADMVLHNGKVVTVDEAIPDGQAVAMRGGRILAVGSDSEIDAYIGEETEVIDLAGQLAIPCSSTAMPTSRASVRPNYSSTSWMWPVGTKSSRWWRRRWKNRVPAD